jgi:hypothetical protein
MKQHFRAQRHRRIDLRIEDVLSLYMKHEHRRLVNRFNNSWCVQASDKAHFN